MRVNREVTLTTYIYSVSLYFRLTLNEPSAGEVEAKIIDSA